MSDRWRVFRSRVQPHWAWAARQPECHNRFAGDCPENHGCDEFPHDYTLAEVIAYADKMARKVER